MKSLLQQRGLRNHSSNFPRRPNHPANFSPGACTNGSAICQASTVIGAVNEQASQLAEVRYDNTLQAALDPKSYTVGCSVDIEPSNHSQSISSSFIDGDTNVVWSPGVSYTLQSNGNSYKTNSEKGPTKSPLSLPMRN